MTALRIPADIMELMTGQARSAAPLEACGLLAGRDDTVEGIFIMKNTDESNEHFSMDPREQFAAVKEMRRHGLQTLAIYHSHPATPARPSQEDIRMALTPGVTHVIVSLEDADEPDVRGYLIEDGQVQPRPLEVVEAIEA